MNTLAGDIEHFFGTSEVEAAIPPKATIPLPKNPKIDVVPQVPQSLTIDFTQINLWKNGTQIKEVVKILKELSNSSNSILSHTQQSGSHEAKQKVLAVSHDLIHVSNRLQYGTIQVGIIGLTKAGKSTFLNALLGKSFLPSSFQPQTAIEVVITHNTSFPDGELYCVKTGSKAVLLARGQLRIHDELRQLNDEARQKGNSKKCDKVILQAYLQFLAGDDIRDVRLEIYDTPGFGEGGAENIEEVVRISVKKMCAFILIMSSHHLKTQSEVDLLRKLKYSHPELFSKLKRMLILVNVQTSAFSDGILSGSSASSIVINDIPVYVSGYLQMLGIDIPPDNIRTFHALWALRCREWIKITALRESQKRTLYNEAMLMLRYIKKENESDQLEREVTDDNFQVTCDILEHSVTHIQQIEVDLRRMVLDNGAAVLLESVVDDTVAVVENQLVPTTDELIEDEQVEQELVKSWMAYRDFLEHEISYGKNELNSLKAGIKRTVQQRVSQNHDKVWDLLGIIVKTKIDEGLRDFTQQGDKDQIIKAMQKVRSNIPPAVKARIKTDWDTIVVEISNIIDNEIKQTFLNVRMHFTDSVLSKWSAGHSSAPQGADSATVTEGLEATSKTFRHTGIVSSAFPFNGITIAIEDNELASYVKQEAKQMYRVHERVVCTRNGFLWLHKDCITYKDSIPYYVTVYEPATGAFMSAMDNTLQLWIKRYDDEVAKYLRDTLSSAINDGMDKLVTVFDEPQQKVNKMVSSMQSVLDNSFLREEKKRLLELVEMLRRSIV